jgi:transaldolase
MNFLENMKIKIFADGADVSQMRLLAEQNYIKGLTTNPSLMFQSGIRDYKKFALETLKFIGEKSISFEVFSDEFSEMKRQAMEISSWGSNVYVKVPVTNTLGKSSRGVIEFLVDNDIKVNVTAVMTLNQVNELAKSLKEGVPSYISIFAGRIADTGINPIGIMKDAIDILSHNNSNELIWASPRELLNLIEAESAGVDIITMSPELLKKLNLLGKDLTEYSRETVDMFYTAGVKAGFSL